MKIVIIFTGLLGLLIGSDGSRVCKCDWLLYRGHCYYFSDSTSLNWFDAEDSCRKSGGYLAKVDDKVENDWILNVAKGIDKKAGAKRRYWLGGRDTQEGIWRWNIDFTVIGWKSWGPGEPNGGKKENCLELNHLISYKWNDMSCLSKLQHICESPMITR